MEVYDLEVCDLVQYFKKQSGKKRSKPGSISHLEITRDRQWFQKHFHTMETFVEQLHSEKESLGHVRPSQVAAVVSS